MPQTTHLLFYKKALNPTSEIFPLRFKELLPLKLRNEVSHKTTSGRDARKCASPSKLYSNNFITEEFIWNFLITAEKCLQEMTGMFECFKKNEFDQVVCAKEIFEFKTCSETSRVIWVLFLVLNSLSDMLHLLFRYKKQQLVNKINWEH